MEIARILSGAFWMEFQKSQSLLKLSASYMAIEATVIPLAAADGPSFSDTRTQLRLRHKESQVAYVGRVCFKS